MAPDQKLLRERMIVIGNRAEHYLRPEDAPTGGAAKDDSIDTNPERNGSLGSIFVIDMMKRWMASPDFAPTLEETTLDGRPCSFPTFRWKESGKLHERYWFDLKRGGEAVQRESFYVEEHLVG